MGWYLVTREANGLEGRSSTLASEASAFAFACDLLVGSIEVLRIEAPDGETIDAAAIAVWCAGRRHKSKP